MGLFGPKWKSKNEKKALKALENISDEMTLLRVVFEAPVGCVCKSAIHRLSDEKLKAVVMGPKYAEKAYGVKFMTEGSWSAGHDVSDLALQDIESIEVLYEIAKMQRGSFRRTCIKDRIRWREADRMEEERKQQAEARKCQEEAEREVRKRQEEAERIIDEARHKAELRNSSSVRLLRECCSDDLEAALNGVSKLLDAGDSHALCAAAGIIEWPYPNDVLKKNIKKEVSVFAEICLKEPRGLEKIAGMRHSEYRLLYEHVIEVLRSRPDMVQKKYISNKAQLWVMKHVPAVFTLKELMQGADGETKLWLMGYRPDLFLYEQCVKDVTERQLTAFTTELRRFVMGNSIYDNFMLNVLNACHPQEDGSYELVNLCLEKLSQASLDCTEAVLPFLDIAATRGNTIHYLIPKKHPVLRKLMYENSYLSLLAETFPDAETVDILVARLQTEPNNYYVLNAVKDLYKSIADPGVLAYLRGRNLKKYERGHSDYGNDRCGTHEDFPAITFEFL